MPFAGLPGKNIQADCNKNTMRRGKCFWTLIPGHSLDDGSAHEAQKDRNHGQAEERNQQGNFTRINTKKTITFLNKNLR